MLDFFDVEVKKDDKKKTITLYPSFYVRKSKDLMIKGHSFYAIWDEEQTAWTTDEERACEIIDKYIDLKEKEFLQNPNNAEYTIHKMGLSRYKSKQYSEWRSYCSSIPDHFNTLDSKIIFTNDNVSKEDFSSKRLNYSMIEGKCDSYDELMSTLYSPEERDKIEWAIGSIIAGDSKTIQKFVVFYGDPGSGKSTVIKIINMLFDGYTTPFNAKALGSPSNNFALEPFKNNPLVAYQDDGDLSKIEDNTILNTLISHEHIVVNEKHKTTYPMKFNAMLFIGTNEPVKITNAKSGIIRRLLDVNPSGKTLPIAKYEQVMDNIPFELGAIAYNCYQKYLSMGKNYYNNYKPIAMLGLTNDFYSFIDDNLDFFLDNKEMMTLNKVWEKYKQYCEYSGMQYRMPLRIVKRELHSYYDSYKDRWNGFYKVYFGFKEEKFNYVFEKEHEDEKPYALSFDETESIFDKEYADTKAQYANSKDKPTMKWDEVTTTLKDIDTHETHYVLLPENHIVIDFDLKNENGEKDFDLNIKEASKWPPTYAEVSKSGGGIHLHYIYDGDAKKLSKMYAEDIEVKVFTGNSSLRRKLTRCNNVPIQRISSGLPLKGDKMVDSRQLESEEQLRGLIYNCLKKKHHGATKPEVDYIYAELKKAYESDMHYDVRDLRGKIVKFAADSTNHSIECLRLVKDMKFCSDDVAEVVINEEAPIVFFDTEVFPNLFVVCWKFQGEDKSVNSMINPTPEDIKELLKYNLIAHNARRYDNHIIWARMMGYTNEELYNLSQKIINGKKGENAAFFKEAYNLSYTDTLDYASNDNKMSLKKWEIKLGIHHQENEYPWDKPVPEDKWNEIVDYCKNDVVALEAVFNATEADFKARCILAELSGLTVNDTTNTHTTKLIVGNDKEPQLLFKYPDLTKEFPGYEYCPTGIDKSRYSDPSLIKKQAKSIYLGEDPSEGGYAWGNPGIYENVDLYDVASMHPSTIDVEDLFGPYTENFRKLKEIRLHIKHKEYDKVRDMFDGKLAKYLTSDEDAKALSTALKTAINSVYGLTSASFPNKLKDPRNVDNVVAKRGALFMIKLKHECQDRGWTVVHCKTDSIKLANATEEMKQFVFDFGKQYGYTFEHEATYEKMCIIDDAQYIAKYKDGPHEYELSTGEKLMTPWTATGKQFQIPFIFKTLFSGDKVVLKDYCITFQTKDELYLDFNENLMVEDEHNYKFVGKVGEFCPVVDGAGGGELLVKNGDKYNAAQGSKGFKWLESEFVKNNNLEDAIDINYFRILLDKAVEKIEQFGDPEQFRKEDIVNTVVDGPEEIEFTAMNKPE